MSGTEDKKESLEEGIATKIKSAGRITEVHTENQGTDSTIPDLTEDRQGTQDERRTHDRRSDYHRGKELPGLLDHN